MPTKAISFFLTLLFFAVIPLQVFGQTGSWDALKELKGREVAVRTGVGEMLFGILDSVDDASIGIRIATRKKVATTSTMLDRNQVDKLWSAKLRLGERSVGKSTLIGTGIGAAVGLVIYAALPRDEYTDGLEVLAVPLGLGFGAAIGAVSGLLIKKGPKKGKLVYAR